MQRRDFVISTLGFAAATAFAPLAPARAERRLRILILGVTPRAFSAATPAAISSRIFAAIALPSMILSMRCTSRKLKV